MSGACLDENEVAELLRGGLIPIRRERVERHIDSCEACRMLVAEVADLDATQLVPAASRPAESPLDVGERVDHFEVLGVLGRGGMGEVYAAQDTKLGRKVALKLVRPSLLGSSVAIARFQREAEATARFSHPNIVTIHAVGEHRGMPYVALEFLEGETLRNRMDSGPFDVEEAVHIGAAITDALDEAHKHGVLHRDLKPDNIHLGSDGRVRVLDFGLAKFVTADEPTLGGPGADSPGLPIDSQLTHAGTAAGTPSYMAPEQWRAAECTEATDVWALGVILYRLISGRTPFEADTMSTLRREVLSDRRPPTLPTAAGAVGPLVLRCLERDPKRRPTTLEISNTLGSALRSRPAARASGRAWLPLVAAAVLLAAGAGIALSLRKQPAPVPAPEPAASTPESTPSQPPPPPHVVETPAPPPAEPQPPPIREEPVVEAKPPTVTPARRPRPRAKRKANKDSLFGTRE